ncbi:hypothetical protein OOZ19_26590 [Saccharopolyspora sp. NFXS83]|uniref:hypothetical protein n=1 Tax=Saccharopolyspora sp. NFXS83 TaxID=2993560 RepID=UPI00224AB734|nr:hypothetical protein [Saccharopolyspora sp. NFXS83]MCX2733828.1 hypothetical protein [Saccharopolyspora sp. NFXS83]
MKAEILHDGITHRANVSWWNDLAISACGKAFPEKTYKPKTFHGGVNCPDCKHAKRQERA